MKLSFHFPLCIGIYHLTGCLIYTITANNVFEKKLLWIAYVIPPVYMIGSGIVSLAAIVIALFTINKKTIAISTASIIINSIYIIWYAKFISEQ